MDYFITTLSNGLRIVHYPTDIAVSYCGFMINAGTRNESSNNEFGMAHFIEHMLFKGTTHRNSWHINNRMESVGGELNAFTTKEDTTFYSIFLNEDFDRACELLCDLVCHSTIPAHELSKEQEVVIDEINSYRDNPPELIYDEFEDRLFANHALGHNILGSEDTVRAFNSQQCLDFIATHYRPEQMVFFSYGKTPWQHITHCVEKYFDPITAPLTTKVGQVDSCCSLDQPHCLGSLNKPFILERDTHQSHVMIGGRSYPLKSEKSAALALLNNMLGGPGMNSRLNQELREKRGLVYTVESSITSYTDTGVFSIYFGSDHEDVKLCTHLVLNQLKHLRDNKLTDMQLHAAQKQLKGQFGVSSANLENIALGLAKGITRFGHYDSLEEIAKRIDAVTPSQLLEVANEILSEDNLMCVMIR